MEPGPPSTGQDPQADDEDRGNRKHQQDHSGTARPLRVDPVFYGQRFDGIFRLLETNPGLFAVEFDSQDFLLALHEGKDLALNAGRIGTNVSHRFATSSGDWPSRSQRFDRILGFFESASCLLPVDFDGFDLLPACTTRESGLRNYRVLGNMLVRAGFRLLACPWRGYGLFHP